MPVQVSRPHVLYTMHVSHPRCECTHSHYYCCIGRYRMHQTKAKTRYENWIRNLHKRILVCGEYRIGRLDTDYEINAEDYMSWDRTHCSECFHARIRCRIVKKLSNFRSPFHFGVLGTAPLFATMSTSLTRRMQSIQLRIVCSECYYNPYIMIKITNKRISSN